MVVGAGFGNSGSVSVAGLYAACLDDIYLALEAGNPIHRLHALLVFTDGIIGRQ